MKNIKSYVNLKAAKLTFRRPFLLKSRLLLQVMILALGQTFNCDSNAPNSYLFFKLLILNLKMWIVTMR